VRDRPCAEADTLRHKSRERSCLTPDLLTLSDLSGNVEVTDGDWVMGNNPEKTSYCSPWVLATVKHDSVAFSQGYVSETFVRRIVRQSNDYFTGDLDIEL
jgi:hypothetical protein